MAYNENHFSPMLPNEGSGSSKASRVTLTEINEIRTKAKAMQAVVCTPVYRKKYLRLVQ